jgi:hypothetical protein
MRDPHPRRADNTVNVLLAPGPCRVGDNTARPKYHEQVTRERGRHERSRVTSHPIPRGRRTFGRLTRGADADPRPVTISNHDEARGQGARVNIDELIAAGGFPSSDFLADYATLAAAGQFIIPVAEIFPLDEWRAAAQLSLSGAPHGKVVLVP